MVEVCDNCMEKGITPSKEYGNPMETNMASFNSTISESIVKTSA